MSNGVQRIVLSEEQLEGALVTCPHACGALEGGDVRQILPRHHCILQKNSHSFSLADWCRQVTKGASTLACTAHHTSCARSSVSSLNAQPFQLTRNLTGRMHGRKGMHSLMLGSSGTDGLIISLRTMPGDHRAVAMIAVLVMRAGLS